MRKKRRRSQYRRGLRAKEKEGDLSPREAPGYEEKKEISVLVRPRAMRKKEISVLERPSGYEEKKEISG